MAVHVGPVDAVPSLAGQVGDVLTGVSVTVQSYAKGLSGWELAVPL